MSVLIDRLIKESNGYHDMCRGQEHLAYYLAKPTPYYFFASPYDFIWGIKNIFPTRLKDAWNVLTGNFGSYHYKEDEDRGETP